MGAPPAARTPPRPAAPRGLGPAWARRSALRFGARFGPRPGDARGAPRAATAIAAALGAVLGLVPALPPGAPPAFAQGAPLEAPLETPLGTPGGPEAAPRPGPAPLPLPEPGTVVSPGPGIAAPDPAPGPGIADPEDTLVEGDPVARPEIGLAGDPIGAAEDLDLGRAFAPGGPAGLGAEPGRIDAGLLARPRRPGERAPLADRDRLAERGPGGTVLTFGLDLGLRAADNPGLRVADEEAGARLVAGLSAGLASRTRLQRLSLGLDAELALSSDAGEGEDAFELAAPRLAFAYEREGARARLGAALRLRRTALDEARLIDLDDPFDGLPEPGDLVISRGTRTDLDAELALATGLERPVGLELEARADLRRYEDVDPREELTDRDVLGLEAALRLEATGRLTTRLVLGATDLDDASGEERRSRSAGVTAVYAAAPTLRFTAALGGARIEAVRFAGTGLLDAEGEELRALRGRETSGVEASFGAVRDLARGTVSAEVGTEIEEGGRRDTIRVGRALEARAGTQLSASVGLSRQDEEDPVVVGDLAVVQDLARGRLRASLRRRAGTGSDGERVAATSASLGWLRQVSRSSSLSLDLDFERVEETGEPESRSELSLAWVRALTPDWSLSAGYERSGRSEGDEEAASNALFVRLGRDFVLRP